MTLIIPLTNSNTAIVVVELSQILKFLLASLAHQQRCWMQNSRNWLYSLPLLRRTWKACVEHLCTILSNFVHSHLIVFNRCHDILVEFITQEKRREKWNGDCDSSQMWICMHAKIFFSGGESNKRVKSISSAFETNHIHTFFHLINGMYAIQRYFAHTHATHNHFAQHRNIFKTFSWNDFKLNGINASTMFELKIFHRHNRRACARVSISAVHIVCVQHFFWCWMFATQIPFSKSNLHTCSLGCLGAKRKMYTCSSVISNSPATHLRENVSILQSRCRYYYYYYYCFSKCIWYDKVKLL